MSGERVFVGRKAELEQFKKVLEDTRGQAILVVGHRGMGKSWLVDKMAQTAENHPNLKCGYVRCEVTPTDSVGSIMALMMDDAFEAARLEEGSFVGTKRRLEQWRSLLNVINIGDLVMSLRPDPQRNTRDQFLERLRLISDKMPESGRAIFIIDPEKYMQEKSASDWRIVVKDLPEKTKFIFAQRTEDELVRSKAFMALENVTLIPQDWLGELVEDDVHDVVRLRAKGVGLSGNVLRDAVRRYEGHPYAVQAALDIVKKTKNVGELPQDPTPEAVAQTQWDEVCKVGADAICLFEAYAILEVGVPDDVVDVVSGLKANARKGLQKDSYLRGLLREEGYGKRIYHAILADYILEQIAEAEKKEYHSRAENAYHAKLKEAREKQSAPDALAATRLPEHVLVTGGRNAFVDAFVNQCYHPLTTLGLLDSAIGLSERALDYVQRGSQWEAIILGNLGLIYKARGDLDKAEQMHTKSLDIDKNLGRLDNMAIHYANLGSVHLTRRDLTKAEEMYLKSLEISEKLGRLAGIADQYGNLAVISQMRGDLDKAEEMHIKALEIEEKLGRLEGMADEYGNLGLVYQTRGDLAKAEQMLEKSLEINLELGRLEDIGMDYANLAMVYLTGGDLTKAEEIHKKSLEIAEKIGSKEIMAADYGNLGLIYRERGDLNKAEAMFTKVLGIHKKLGHQEGIVTDYGNLGSIYQVRSDLTKAEEMHKKSLEINERLGRLEGMARQYANLGSVYEKRGDNVKARECWEKALELFEKIGMKPEIEKTQKLIDELEDK